jgi:hypothetical protein
MRRWGPCQVPLSSDLLGRLPVLQSAIQQDLPLPVHGGLGGTADIITGDTRGGRNNPRSHGGRHFCPPR